MKLGRNDPCLCGSGKKYKKCCLQRNGAQPANPIISPSDIEEFQKKVLEHQRAAEERRRRYGNVRPIIHIDFQGNKFVAAGSELHYSPNWKTFPDFLLDYIRHVLGPDWGNSELKKPFSERHQILQWYDHLCAFQRQQEPGPDGVCESIPDGVVAAYWLLAYDLYILRHHTALQAEVIRRLKHRDQFQGARYELFVAATCIRAGFEIAYEDEADRKKKHPEFVATHKHKSQMISVEAKSRHRPGILGFPGQRQPASKIKADVGKLLTQAILKATGHPYVIFLDLNLPPSPGKIFEKPWFDEIRKTVDRAGRRSKDDLDPFNLLVFTNHPHHYGEEGTPDPAKDTLSVFSQHPKVSAGHPETILEIDNAARQYGNIPNEFPKDPFA